MVTCNRIGYSIEYSMVLESRYHCFLKFRLPTSHHQLWVYRMHLRQAAKSLHHLRIWSVSIRLVAGFQRWSAKKWAIL